MLANHFSPPFEQLRTTFLLCRDAHSNPQDCQCTHLATHLEPSYQVGMDPWSLEKGNAKKKCKKKWSNWQTGFYVQVFLTLWLQTPHHISVLLLETVQIICRSPGTGHWAWTLETCSSCITVMFHGWVTSVKWSYLPVPQLFPLWSWDSDMWVKMITFNFNTAVKVCCVRTSRLTQLPGCLEPGRLPWTEEIM